MESSVEILEKFWAEHSHTFTILRIDAGPCFAGELWKHGFVFNAYGICMIRHVFFRSCCSFGDDKADFSYPDFTLSCGYDIRLLFVGCMSNLALFLILLPCVSHHACTSDMNFAGLSLSPLSFLMLCLVLIICTSLH